MCTSGVKLGSKRSLTDALVTGVRPCIPFDGYSVGDHVQGASYCRGVNRIPPLRSHKDVVA